MEEAKASAKRRKWYAKIDRAYEKALGNIPMAAPILLRFEQTSDANEIASLLAETVDVGHEMRRVDAREKWPTDLDVGSVFRKWQQHWGNEAVWALERAISQRDGIAFQEPEFYRLITSRLEAFAGEEAQLDRKTNLQHFLGKAKPEQTAAFFQQVLDAPNP